MIDRDLAELYGVETKYLNRQVKRNIERFPEEFMFRINNKEKNELVTNWHQFKMLKHSSQNPLVFTEHGVAMLASVLNSQRAIDVNIQIIKAFVRLRELMETHHGLLAKIEEMEKKYDGQFQIVFDAIRQLLDPPAKKARKIGFQK